MSSERTRSTRNTEEIDAPTASFSVLVLTPFEHTLLLPSMGQVKKYATHRSLDAHAGFISE